MAWTQADLTAIERALKQGTRRVRLDSGKEIEYRTIDELEQLRRTITAELNAGTAKAHVQPRHQLASFADD